MRVPKNTETLRSNRRLKKNKVSALILGRFVKNDKADS